MIYRLGRDDVDPQQQIMLTISSASGQTTGLIADDLTADPAGSTPSTGEAGTNHLKLRAPWRRTC